MSDALILTDGPTKHNALIGVLRRAFQGGKAKPNALDSEKHTLGVQPLDQVFEPRTLLADQVLLGHFQPVYKKRVRFNRLTAHLGDRIGLDSAPVKVGIEQGKPEIGLGALVLGCCARDNQDLVGPLCARRPDLAAIDGVARIGSLGLCLQAGSIEARIGLCDGKAHLLLAGDDLGQVFLLLLLCPELLQGLGPEDVQVDGGRSGIASARAGDGLHHQSRLGQPEARSAILFWKRNAQPATRRHGIAERFWPVTCLIGRGPVFVIKVRAGARHGILDRKLVLTHGGDLVHSGQSFPKAT